MYKRSQLKDVGIFAPQRWGRSTYLTPLLHSYLSGLLDPHNFPLELTRA